MIQESCPRFVWWVNTCLLIRSQICIQQKFCQSSRQDFQLLVFSTAPHLAISGRLDIRAPNVQQSAVEGLKGYWGLPSGLGCVVESLCPNRRCRIQRIALGPGNQDSGRNCTAAWHFMISNQNTRIHHAKSVFFFCCFSAMLRGPPLSNVNISDTKKSYRRSAGGKTTKILRSFN